MNIGNIYIINLTLIINLFDAFYFILNYFSGVVGESVIWIPAGIGLGMLLVLGAQYWPFLFVGAAFGEMGGGHDLLMGMQLAFGGLLGCFAAYFLLARNFKFNLHLQSLGDYGRLLGASVVGATTATTLRGGNRGNWSST
ncbi:MAG: hypothetical protein WCJ51_04525, partial [Candidatus Moraniibacteriota bacterium]